jgi:hypothetical protein
MDTAKGVIVGMGDISMSTARPPWNDDIQMETAKAGTTVKQGGLQMWERELLESPEIKRKATVAQLCECLVHCSRRQAVKISLFWWPCKQPFTQSVDLTHIISRLP